MKDEEIRDYIKKEAEHIPVPDSLAPERVKEKLASVKQSNQKRRHRIRALTAAAACLLILAVAGAAIIPRVFRALPATEWTTLMPEEKQNSPAEEDAPAPDGISYEEICEQINSYNGTAYKNKDLYYEYEAAMDGELNEAAADSSFNSEETAGDSAGTGEAPLRSDAASKYSTSDYSETDTQVADVMEGDIVKTDGRYIYTMQNGVYGFEISIYRAEGKSVKNITKLFVENQNCSEMYLENNKLIAIGDNWNSSSSRSQTKDNPSNEAETGITVFDIQNPEKPGKGRTLTQSGNYRTSRISDGYLYTFSEFRVLGQDYSPEQPEEYIPRTDHTLLPETSLHSLCGVPGNCYMVMTSLAVGSNKDFSDKEKINFENVSAAFGDSSVYYMSNDNIYIAAPTENGRTDIIKYHYKDGAFKKTADREIRGQIANSYYFHEYQGCLAFVYTHTTAGGYSTNGLCTLDKNLKPLGEIANLGVDEKIYSSYYIDNMAYFVTYRETDPVFAVDIKDPKKPRLKAELKLPGFSSYLHSFGEDLLLGIGESDLKNQFSDFSRGVKLSLFSIKNPTKLKEVMKKLLSANSRSIASENHKAVFVDEERKLIGLGIDTYSSDTSHYILYRYENGKLKELFRQKISDISAARGLRINNFFYVADTEEDKIFCFPL